MKLAILTFLIGWNIPPLFRGHYSAVDLGGTVALLMVLVVSFVFEKIK